MRKKKWKERICALVLAVLMPLTSILPNVVMAANAQDSAPVETAAETEGETPAAAEPAGEGTKAGEMAAGEGSTQPEVKAAPVQVEVTFTVKDEKNNPFEGAKVWVYEKGQSPSGEGKKTDVNGQAKFTLQNDKAYKYKAIREKYNPVVDQDINLSNNNISVSLAAPMNPIQVNPNTSVVVKVGETLEMRVVNKVEGVEYSWDSTNKDLVQVDPKSGVVRGIAKGNTNANITVSGNGMTTTQPITVKAVPEIKFTVNPASGENVNSIKLEAELPSDADGAVTFYKDSIATGNELGTVQLVSGKASLELKDGTGIDLIGQKKFAVKYLGSDKAFYVENTKDCITGNYLKELQLELKETKTDKTYGDQPFKVPDVKGTTAGDRDQSQITYTSDKTDVIEVDATGNLVIKGIGTAVISVTIPASSQYAQSTAAYEVTVTPKDLGELQLTDFEWQPVEAEKVYDGSSKIKEIQGKLTDPSKKWLVGSDEIVVTAEGDVNKADVGSYDKCEITKISTAGNDNYTFQIPLDKEQSKSQVDLKSPFTINKRNVYLQVSQAEGKAVTAYYGTGMDGIRKAIQKAMSDKEMWVDLAGTVGQIHAGQEEGLLDADKNILADLADRTEIVVKTDTYYVGKYPGILKPQILAGKDVVGNYQLLVDETAADSVTGTNPYYGSLEIRQETIGDNDLWDQLEVDGANSQHIFQNTNDGVLWVSADGKIAFNLKDKIYYDTVNILNGNGTPVKNYLEIDPKDVAENAVSDAENEIYLSQQNQSGTRTTSSDAKADQNNQIPAGTVKIDNQVPTVDFNILGTNDLKSLLSGEWIFNLFTNKGHTENITVTDGAGSGVASYAYSLLAVLPGDDISAKVREAAENGIWTELKDNSINIPGNENQGYYIALVKVIDHVGNEAVYASNGMVYETAHPNVDIKIDSKSEVDNIYGGDIDYTLTVTDPGEIYSGISKIQVEVLTEGSLTPIPGDKVQRINSFILENEDLNALKGINTNAGNYTQDNLSKKSEYEIKGKLAAENCNSNNVVLSVKAWDLAGNEMPEKREALIIDTQKPEISISYREQDALNGTYYNNDRVMEITYTERNFKEELAVFDVKLISTDGVVLDQQMNLSQLVSGEADGISAVLVKDSAEGKPKDQYPLQRTIQYNITFNGGVEEDLDYSILPSLTDEAGNSSEAVEEQKFTVDKKAPVMEISFDNNQEKNGHFFKKERVMTITYTERNFIETSLSFDVLGSDEAVSLDELKAMEGIVVKQAAETDESAKDTHTYQITFGEDKKDIDFKCVPHAADKAGNNGTVKYEADTKAPEEFTVDMIPPVMSVNYSTLDKQNNKMADLLSDNIGTEEKNRVYKNSSIVAEVSITERNFAAGTTFTEEEMLVTESAVDVAGEAVTVTDQKGPAGTVSNWISAEGETDTRKQSFTFKEDANYSFNMTYMDEAGNTAVLVKDSDKGHLFTVDTTAPTGKIQEPDKNIIEKFLDTITFKFFSNKEKQITYLTAAQDTTSPVKTSYYKHYPGRDARGEIEPLTEQELKAIANWSLLSGTKEGDFVIRKTLPDETDTKDYYSYSIGMDEQIIPYEKLEDKAGNVTYLDANGAICEDQEGDIEINITTEAPETTFGVEKEEVVYDGDVYFDINVKDLPSEDAAGNEIFSGLKKIVYSVSVNGEAGSVEGEKEYKGADRTETDTIKDIKIPSEEYNSNDIVIYVTAWDFAGNEWHNSRALKIDTTDPQISVEYAENDAANEKYFSHDRTMTITYTERNINQEGLKSYLKSGNKEYPEILLNQLEGIQEEAGFELVSIKDSQEEREAKDYDDDRTLTCVLKFNGGKTKDMDYEILPSIEDQAGRKLVKAEDITYAGQTANQAFTVDKVKPVMKTDYYQVDEDGKVMEKINVSTDEINRLYKNETVRAVVRIDERNFDLEKAFSEEYRQVIPHFAGKTHEGAEADLSAFETAAVSSEKWETKGTMHTLTLDFKADGDYSLNLEYFDLARNELETPYETHYFTVDNTVPEIDVSYMADGKAVTPGELESDPLYQSAVITATVKITERNFAREDQAEKFEKGKMNLTYTAKDVDGKAVSVDNFPENADTRGKWISDGYVRTQVFTFEVDANYSLALTYKDLAGNQADYGRKYFTVDQTAPTGSITHEGSPVWKKFIDTITFGIFKNKTQSFALASADQTSGVASMEYYKYIPGAETRGTFNGLTVKQLDEITDWTAGSVVTVHPNQQAVIYEKIVDRAGNVTYINPDQGVIVDDVKPQAPQITLTMAEPSQGIYQGDVSFNIDVKDPEAGGTYAGLQWVEYEILNNGRQTQYHRYAGETFVPADRVQSFHHSETVLASLNNSNHVTIRVKAMDNAGNDSEFKKEIKIDTVDPEVKITYDLNSPSNGRYYNATRTATVSVRERNFDPNAVTFTITNTDGTMPSISGWSISPMAGESDDAINTCNVSFQADGDYTITMNCKDRSGRSSHYTQVDDFTIDKTAPVINVSFDNNSALHAGYYDKPRTATVTINEHNFNGAEVQAAVSASLQSQGISAPGISGWSGGDVHTGSIYFGQDGDYSFTINYTDLAGNPAVAYVQDQFTVDQTKPEIEIFDIEDKSANNGVVAPGIRYSDVNYDPAGVKITIRGPKHTEKAIDGIRTEIANGQSIKMADFAYEEAVDDVYTLTAQVADQAGNTDEKSVTFSVNRFGSNFLFEKSTEEFLDQYYSNKEQDLVITEVNVDTLVHNGITYGLDGELVNLEKGTDYTVKESGGEASWKSYQYTVKAENFEQEGLYNVTIDSTDRANNEVNNKVKEADIEFVIDKTKPTVVITGVEDDGQYRTNSRDIAIAVSDNVALDSLDVYVDDTQTPTKSYDAGTIKKQKGEIPFSLESANDWQKIKAMATDAAGNTADTEELRVLITANVLVQFYRNTPLLVGSSVGLIAVVALISLILAKKKKEKKKEA